MQRDTIKRSKSLKNQPFSRDPTLAAAARFAPHCLPAFAKNQRDYEQSRNGIRPRQVPNCINYQSHQGDERKISA
jgi:hypothetical protein